MIGLVLVHRISVASGRTLIKAQILWRYKPLHVLRLHL